VPFVRSSLDKLPGGRADIDTVDSVPVGTVAIVGTLAIGPDWVAKGHRGKWSLLPAASVASISVVAPPGWKQLMTMGAFMAPPPDLVFATREGVAFRIPIDQVNRRARDALLSAVGSSTRISAVARRFLG